MLQGSNTIDVISLINKQVTNSSKSKIFHLANSQISWKILFEFSTGKWRYINGIPSIISYRWTKKAFYGITSSSIPDKLSSYEKSHDIRHTVEESFHRNEYFLRRFFPPRVKIYIFLVYKYFSIYLYISWLFPTLRLIKSLFVKNCKTHDHFAFILFKYILI